VPLGIVSDSEMEKEVETLRIVPSNSLGRGLGNKEVPESLRKIIGENAVEEGSAVTKTLTRALGISDSSLSAYKNGSTSTTSYHSPDAELKKHINKTKERIVKKARNRLVASLNAITPEKLADENPRDLAGIAKDMSVIIKNFEPGDDGQRTQPLVIFAPIQVTEERFEVIDVQASE
jgi:hypothetical protein